MKKLIGKLFIFIILVFLTSCNTKSSDTIKIGAILPLSGDIASYGKRAQNGIELALLEINNSKDYNFRLEVDFQDDKGIPKDAVNIMNRFCTIDKIQVVIGGASSTESLSMQPIANENKVVQISPISSSPDLTKKDYFFRICPSDAFQAIIMANWMNELSVKKVGILYINNSWGSSLKEGFTKKFTELGGQIILNETMNEGDKDFKTQLTKIIHTEPDAIYCISYGPQGGIMLKQLKELGYNKKIFGADVWSSPELLTSAGNASEGVYLIKPAEYKDSTYLKFLEKYKNKYNEVPDVYAAYSYDLTFIIAQALKNGKKFGEEIKEYLLAMPAYDGVTGTTKFDEFGDCNTKSFIRLQIKNKEFIEVK
jgi:branched-chain amino acid transport system substrate-binding protein